ncbi:hypothetical protein BKA82DRAFT_4329832 [Pisolithus tinctorius]|nr:hypothetical protein BKA82DRAFT_4329832 [Pisolithus tinctorius]
MWVLTGHFLTDDAPLLLHVQGLLDDWALYCSRIEFELAEFLFKCGNPLFTNHTDLYCVIDSMSVGTVKWENFKITYKRKWDGQDEPDEQDEVIELGSPGGQDGQDGQDEPEAPWMFDIYDVWYRDPRQVIHNLLRHADIKDKMDFIPYWEFNATSDQRHWEDFMLGDWAWDEADKIISDNPLVGRATLVPIILGSDKTTVSVATGQTDYYLLYLSIGNVHNTTHHAHCDVVVLIGFLAMPKTTREHANTQVFCKFKKQLFHSLLARVLWSLGPAMTAPETVLFGDQYYQRVIYALTAYIADYEEQVLLSCIVHKWCPKCLTHQENLDEDALWHHHEHTELIIRELGPLTLWDECGIDGDIVPFTSRFPHADIQRMLLPDILHQLIKGGFKDHLVDWVYIAAIEGYVPQDVDALACFHLYCEVFWNAQVVAMFSLPQQHAMKHYPYLICQFSTPNGLCSSITESKHIKAVKWPYWCTNHFQALGQMLVINQRLDKFAVACADFKRHGMLRGTCLSHVLVTLGASILRYGADEPTASFEEDPGDMDDSPMSVEAHTCARNTRDLATELNIPHLLNILCCFLQSQLQQDDHDPEDVPLDECPFYDGCIHVYNSASLTFYAPGMLGLDVARILYTEYPCVIVRWFDCIGDGPDTCTGMWIVHVCNAQDITIIHIDTIYRAAHLIPVYANHQIDPASIKPNESYDKFLYYYVNKFADHHVFEIAS